VVPDNLEIGRRAALHLLDRGLRRFAYCGYAGNYWSTQRRNGFEQVLREAGRTCDVFEAGDNCQPALADWLSGLKTPVGVLGGNDVRAVDVIHAAAGLGLRVPQHVVVLGVDNSELICDFMNPTLSSVDSRPARIGYEAAALLDRILGGDTAPAETRIEPAGVIARQSTDMLAVADPLVAEAVRRVRAGATTGAPLDALLAEIPMSRSTIERRFKETIGRTPGAEVRRIRVERARQLLLETSLPLKQVARRSGFSTARHMSEAFRRDLDARPTDYRKPPHD
jgi:LacI family transcriptional regulator